jgi:hypothetical protein
MRGNPPPGYTRIAPYLLYEDTASPSIHASVQQTLSTLPDTEGVRARSL